MALESSITRSILIYLNGLSGCCAEKVKGGATASGRADINACYRGHCLRIEVKTPDHKNRTSPKQDHNLEKWYRAGAVTMVVYSLDDLKQLLEFVKVWKPGLYVLEMDGCMSWIKIPERS